MSDLDSELFINLFREEAQACIRDLRNALRVLWKQHDNPQAMRDAQRAAHTIKGSAGLVNRASLADLSREIEDGFKAANARGVFFDRNQLMHYARLAHKLADEIERL